MLLCMDMVPGRHPGNEPTAVREIALERAAKHYALQGKPAADADESTQAFDDVVGILSESWLDGLRVGQLLAPGDQELTSIREAVGRVDRQSPSWAEPWGCPDEVWQLVGRESAGDLEYWAFEMGKAAYGRQERREAQGFPEFGRIELRAMSALWFEGLWVGALTRTAIADAAGAKPEPAWL